MALAGRSGGDGAVMGGIPSGRLQLAVMQYGAGRWRLLVVAAKLLPDPSSPFVLPPAPAVIGRREEQWAARPLGRS